MSNTIEKEKLKQTSKEKMKPPRMWQVVMLNDDFTPMDFVVYCLMNIFKKSPEQATQIMLQVHEQGRGLAGVYTKDIAVTKQTEVMDLAKLNEHPLQVIIQEAP
jgi:ATP-dependent Clp protease adaptor protein ClpS